MLLIVKLLYLMKIIAMSVISSMNISLNNNRLLRLKKKKLTPGSVAKGKSEYTFKKLTEEEKAIIIKRIRKETEKKEKLRKRLFWGLVIFVLSITLLILYFILHVTVKF